MGKKFFFLIQGVNIVIFSELQVNIIETIISIIVIIYDNKQTKSITKVIALFFLKFFVFNQCDVISQFHDLFILREFFLFKF